AVRDIHAKRTQGTREAERATNEWNLATCLHLKQEQGSSNRPKLEIFIQDIRAKGTRGTRKGEMAEKRQGGPQMNQNMPRVRRGKVRNLAKCFTKNPKGVFWPAAPANESGHATCPSGKTFSKDEPKDELEPNTCHPSGGAWGKFEKISKMQKE
ncbi:hypothetical protein KI387_014894, partial [Taxus chinensis]